MISRYDAIRKVIKYRSIVCVFRFYCLLIKVTDVSLFHLAPIETHRILSFHHIFMNQCPHECSTYR